MSRPFLTAGVKLLLIAFPLFFSCHKKDDTLYLDLTVVDNDTGQPVPSSVGLQYDSSPIQGSGYTTEILLGQTDASGKLKTTADTDDKYHLSVVIYGGANYTSVFPQYWGSLYQPVYPGSKSPMTLRLKRNYNYLVSVENVNCFDSTDSIRVVPSEGFGPSWRKTGCGDSTYYFTGSNTCSFSTANPALSFDVTVKRNGIVTEFQHQANMQFGVVTPVHITY